MIAPLRSALTNLAGDDSGQTMVEFALGIWITLYMIMGIVDLGRALYAYNVVANTAREGARYGTVLSHTCSQITAYAQGKAYVTPPAAVAVTSPGTPGVPTNPVVVTATYTFTPITPLIGNLWGGGPLILTASSAMYVEKSNLTTRSGCP